MPSFAGGLLLFVLASSSNAAELMYWNIDGITREALVVEPLRASNSKHPLRLVFMVVIYIHEGGDTFAPAARPLIVQFFKEHSRESR